MLTYLHHVNYEEYENASSMLHLVDVLSSDEDSPSGPNGPPGEHVTGMMAAAAAVANTTLAGCDNGPAGDASGFTVSVPTLVLITWTLLCMLYSWWMLRASPWHDMNYVEKPPVTVLIPAELCTTEEVEPVVEGLVTVTLKRVHGRLKKAQESSNHGRILKYMQGKNWLCTMLTHLPGSNFERNRVMESLAGDQVAVRLV
jgi:hypothetical protein